MYDGGEPLPEPTRALLEQSLRSDDPRVRDTALDELEAYGPPDGEAVLLRFADSPSWAEAEALVKVSVLRALRRMRSGRALPLFVRVAFTEEGRPLREAVHGLCASAAPEAAEPLRALAGGDDRRRRNLVVRYLRRAGEREAAGEARELRRDAKREAREERREERKERRGEGRQP